MFIIILSSMLYNLNNDNQFKKTYLQSIHFSSHNLCDEMTGEC
jgi:hypothetical protein